MFQFVIFMFCLSEKKEILVFLVTLASICIVTQSKEFINSTNIDQKNHLVRNKRQLLNGFEFVDCVLPPYPENGKWRIIGGSGSPGSTILPNTLIEFSCNEGFTMEPQKKYYICNTDWNPLKMPQCKANICPPLKSSLSTKSLRCFDGNGQSIHCNTVSHGGVVTLKCAQFYEIKKGQESTIRCLNGQWTAPTACEPICGKEREVKTRSLRAINYEEQHGEPIHPWIVTLFRLTESTPEYICSASLMSPSHILTAAHCVTDQYGVVHSVEQYQVAAGKAYSEYGDPRDLTSQYVEVGTITVPPFYKGRNTNYRDDIALLKTKIPFRLSALVQPVCFKGLKDINLNEGDEGIFSLWGLDKNHKLTKEVKMFTTKKDDEKCRKTLSPHFVREYLSENKVCTLFPETRSLCTGYSGAGWMFKNPIDDRFYIHGISSLAERGEDFCVKSATICTNTTSYYDFVIQNTDDL